MSSKRAAGIAADGVSGNTRKSSESGLVGNFQTEKGPIPRWTGEALKTAIFEAHVKFKDIAKLNKVSRFDVANFVHKRFTKISRSKRVQLLNWFRQAGFLPQPAPKHRHRCPVCGAIHIMKEGKKHV